MIATADAAVTPDQVFPDLFQVLNRIVTKPEQQRFLEHLYDKITEHQGSDARVDQLLKQVVLLLVPDLEQTNQWVRAAKVLQQAGYYNRAIADYLKDGAHDEAARCAEKSGDLRGAMQLYQKANMLTHAAVLASRLGEGEQAKRLYNDAIKYFVSQKDYHQAAGAARQAGLMHQALELEATQIEHVGYTDSSLMYQKLVDEAIQIGDAELAISLATRGELYDQAISLATQNNQLDAVPRLYKQYLESLYPNERLPVFRRYVAFLNEHSSPSAIKLAYKQEIETLVKHNAFWGAAQLAGEIRLDDRAELYRQAMVQAEVQADFDQAAQAAEKIGLTSEVKEYRELSELLS